MEEFRLYIPLVLVILLNPTSVASSECSDGLFKHYYDTGTTEPTVKLSVVMSIRRQGEGMTCGPIVESQLQVLAAIQWTVERINDGGLMPFAKLGT